MATEPEQRHMDVRAQRLVVAALRLVAEGHTCAGKCLLCRELEAAAQEYDGTEFSWKTENKVSAFIVEQ